MAKKLQKNMNEKIRMNLSYNIFYRVVYTLIRIANKTKLTYNEVNVLVWYLLIPLSWCIMTDFIIRLSLFTFTFILYWILLLIKHQNDFQEWCNWVFQKSVDFLLWFHKIGWNYERASVVVCCLVPILIYIILGVILLYLRN